MKKRITTLMALVLVLMLMCSMSAFAADTSGRGDDYWDWDNGQSFGWNIASSFTALDNNRQGKPIPFQDKSVYDAVAAGVKVYLGQLPADKEITVANINAAVAAGELTEIQIGGFYGKGSTPSFNQNLTVKTVKEKGLIVVADKGLTFAATSICCNDVYGYNCQTASRGYAGNFNESTKHGTAKILNLTPAMFRENGVFHQGRGNAWLMLSVAKDAEYSIIYKVWNENLGDFKVENVNSYPAGAEVKPYVAPAKAAFTFDGWYTDEAMKSAWTALGIMPENDIVVYGKYVPYLDKDDHFNYLMGYPDGTVQPLKNISRAEAATLFYRLLKEDKRAENLTTENKLSDVNGEWYSCAISTLTKIGILTGYADGTFLPNKDITRAEMATIIAKFADLTDEELTFTDIEGHWVQDYIEHAAGNGWIAGYEDGTFKPESFINRAETVTMINRVLDRVPSKAENLLPGLEVFSDCAADDWFYCAIEEATNAHDYDRVQGSKADDVWKELKPNRDWTSFEK